MEHDEVAPTSNAEPSNSRVGAEYAFSTSWHQIYTSEPFGELRRRRRRFIAPALLSTTGVFLVFILLSAYVPDFIGASIYQGLTLGMVLLILQYVGIYVATIVYLRKAKRIYAPLANRLSQQVASVVRIDSQPRSGNGHV